ncbi:hypothetical protein [Streptomyces sp. CAU 1734]|uniref:hypothetical protein n=1 Tax=Streptomyces sp. CAU 1734 TaxID=3140360 RepID=UPI003261090F
MNDMRRVLRCWAYSAGYIESELDDVVNKVYGLIAHELAERIRAHDYDPGKVGPVHLAFEAAADLIDPEVSS